MKKLKLGLLGRDVSGSESERMHRFILSAQGVACDYENVSAGAEEFVPAVNACFGRRTASTSLFPTSGRYFSI